jgi:anti-sigma B factor antagonist
MYQLVAAGPRIDAGTVGTLRGCLNDAIVTGTGPLVLDLSAVQTVDATGLAMLLGIERRAAGADRELLLRGVPLRVARLLRATGLSRVLRHEEPSGLGSPPCVHSPVAAPV